MLDCLAYALEHRIDHGVWGGTDEAERRRIRKARNRPLRLA
jgi:WhiB family redox-sensing transcriptional regulator